MARLADAIYQIVKKNRGNCLIANEQLIGVLIYTGWTHDAVIVHNRHTRDFKSIFKKGDI